MREAHIQRPARPESLPALLGFLDREAAAAGLDDDLAFSLRLAAEEACTNVIRHGYAGRSPGPLALAFYADENAATVVLSDEAPAFDPADAPPPDLDAPLEERPVGGLGWHLVRQLVDEVRHEAVPGGGNRLTLVKRRPTHTQ